MKRLRTVTVAMAIAIFTGCSVYEINYTVDPQTEFLRFHTFAFYDDETSDAIVGGFGVDAITLNTAIQSSLREQLQSKGLSLSTPETADIWINYQAVAETSVSDRYRYNVEELNQSYRRQQIRYSSSFDANRRFQSISDKSAIVVDVIDRNASQVVWRGTLEMPLDLEDPEWQRLDAIRKAVNKLLRKFPSQ
jgi:hypothetical protein